MEDIDIQWAQEVGRRIARMTPNEIKAYTPEQQCDYPGCCDKAEIHCAMLGCSHFVCETHGNGIYEETPDHSVEICWSCAGKGWGEAQQSKEASK